jgi:tRNA (cytidine/uridine-2'-O-)-methyltransferase
MDYIDLVEVKRFSSWEKFQQNHQGRIILMTTKASIPYTDFEFKNGDILMAGQESVGVPDTVHQSVQGRVIIPMHGQARSMNVINASAMIIGEALRQVK